MSNSDNMTVLGVGAHPSDVFPLIGGTIAKHTERGDNVVLLSLTHGIEVHTEDLVGKSVYAEPFESPRRQVAVDYLEY